MRENRCSASSNLFPLTHAAITALYCEGRKGGRKNEIKRSNEDEAGGQERDGVVRE